MPIVQGTNYLRINTTAVLLDSTFDLTLKDNTNNVFPKSLIEANTALGVGVINLPSIASLGAAANSCEVVIVVDVATNNVTVDPALTDKIGGLAAGAPYTITAGASGQNLVLYPVDGTTWGFNFTA
jgi:hypothetical protein